MGRCFLFEYEWMRIHGSVSRGRHWTLELSLGPPYGRQREDGLEAVSGWGRGRQVTGYFSSLWSMTPGPKAAANNFAMCFSCQSM